MHASYSEEALALQDAPRRHRVVSLFSGILGFDLGIHELETQFFFSDFKSHTLPIYVPV